MLELLAQLVVGADGLHSTVRMLVFGHETRFVHHLGLYVATLPLDRFATDPTTILMYNTPGRSFTVHPERGNAGAAFIFRGPARPGPDSTIAIPMRTSGSFSTLTPAPVGKHRSYSTGYASPTTYISTRSVRFGCRPGRMAGWHCLVMPFPACLCSETDPAWP